MSPHTPGDGCGYRAMSPDNTNGEGGEPLVNILSRII